MTQDRVNSSGLPLWTARALHIGMLSSIGGAYALFVRTGEMSDGTNFSSDTSWFDDYTVGAGALAVVAFATCIGLIWYSQRPEVQQSEFERGLQIHSEVIDEIDRRTSR